MKIASFNINRRLPNLLRWLREAGPDIVCLQELKAADAEFPTEAIRPAGYDAVWRGEKRWNGVGILARWADILPPAGFVNAKALGFEADDSLAAAVAAEERAGGTVLAATGDALRGDPSDKLRWRCRSRAKTRRSIGATVRRG
jgi:exodeoxyribonuclease III